MLEISDLEVVYHRGGQTVTAVTGASLSVSRGQIVALVGETGCGKSSLARAAVGLLPPARGQVVFDGRPVNLLGGRTRSPAEARLQLVFQNPYGSLNPRRRIGDQLADGLGVSGDHGHVRGRARVRQLLEQVGLPPAASDRYPHEFSGGQRQRIAIARALSAEPSIVVLDEPLASLDASAQAQIAKLLLELAHDLDIGMLLISHDLSIVRHISQVLYVMYLGTLVESGPTRAVAAHPRHPYTRALFAAIPRADRYGCLPEALGGQVPDPAHRPSGCPFHPRCPCAFDRCRVDPPPLFTVVDRQVACWLED
jgi:peptide/nickel transport system ATP-binding protein